MAERLNTRIEKCENTHLSGENDTTKNVKISRDSGQKHNWKEHICPNRYYRVVVSDFLTTKLFLCTQIYTCTCMVSARIAISLFRSNILSYNV